MTYRCTVGTSQCLSSQLCLGRAESRPARRLRNIDDRRGEETMNDFHDRVVLITGAGSGIGRQLARLFAAEGARVAALDLHGAALEALAGELAGKPVATAMADVTDLQA